MRIFVGMELWVEGIVNSKDFEVEVCLVYLWKSKEIVI